MLRIIIPAYNEQSQIQEVLTQIHEILTSESVDFEIYVVDDGSTDGSDRIVKSVSESLPVRLLQHPRNLGVSTAFRTGFDAVLKQCNPGDRVLTMEANRNADARLIPKMLKTMDQGADLVLASCYAPGGKVVGDPLLRLILSKGVNFILRILFPCNGIHTYTSFYRLWSPEILWKLHGMTDGKYFFQEGFGCMADMLIKSRHIPGIRIKEIPFILVSDIKDSGSKMNIGRTILGYFHLFSSNLLFKPKVKSE